MNIPKILKWRMSILALSLIMSLILCVPVVQAQSLVKYFNYNRCL
jgi:hypothetical protein